MKKIIPFLLVAVLTACGQSDGPQKSAGSAANIPTVEELAANPERLKELRQQCKTDRPKLGDVLCNRVAEATRKRFYGDGETPHTAEGAACFDRGRFATNIDFLTDTPQRACACDVFRWLATALILSFARSFCLKRSLTGTDAAPILTPPARPCAAFP